MLIEEIEKKIVQKKLIEDGSRILVGLSGGADSVFLFHLLRLLRDKHNYVLFAAHLDHGLRGAESNEDFEFVSRLCEKYDISLVAERIDILENAKRKKLSVEEAGREARYDLFRRTCDIHDCSVIVLGHHLNDQAETVLHNMIRGSGLRGLGGIREKRNNIVRPILAVSKQELLVWLRDNGLNWREDKSNQDLKYTRNKIRHEIIPLMKKLNPNVERNLAEMSNSLRDDESFIQNHVDEYISGAVEIYGKLGITITKGSFEKQHRSIRHRVYRLCYMNLTGNSLERKYLDQIETGMENKSTCDLPGGIFIRSNKDKVFIGSKVKSKDKYIFDLDMESGNQIVDSLKIKTKIFLKDDLKDYNVKDTSGRVAYLDYDKIDGSLFIRNRRKEDAYIPFGYHGLKQVKKIFSESGLGAYASSKLPVIVDIQGRVVWAATGRINESYAIRENTNKILRLEIVSLIERL